MEVRYGAIEKNLSFDNGTQGTFEGETPQGSQNFLQEESSYASLAKYFDFNSAAKAKEARRRSITTQMAVCCTIVVLVSSWFAVMMRSPNISVGGLKSHDDKFDYIVVGAGPAGIVAAVNIARRLEKEAKMSHSIPRKVLLLESGTKSQSAVLKQLDGDSPRSVRTSNNLSPNSFDVPFMWNTLSKRDGGNNTDFLSHHWPLEILGRAVGGSGIHNAMINVRALKTDFDKWDVPNFSAEEMIPYFNRLETYDTSTPVPDLWSNNPPSSKRGSDGPLNTIVGNSVTSPVAEDFITSSLAAGIPLASLGFNDPEPNKRIGVSYYEFNIRNRLRDSAAKAILSPDDKNIPFPKNLIIKTDATVEKILFDECEKDTVEDERVEMPCLPKSAGVRYYSSETGTVTDVKLRRPSEKKLKKKIERDTEVILAAGAVLTPQLLANSGIHDNGDLVHLKGVGRNLQDHPVVGVVFQAKENLSESIESYFNMDTDGKEAFHSYLNSMTDLMSSGTSDNMSENAKIYGTPGFAVGAFLRSPHSDENDQEAPEDRSPDIQLTFFPHTIEPHFTQQYDLTRPNKIDYILITVALLKPEARYHLDLHHHASKPEDHSTPKIAQTAREIFEKKYRFKVPDILGGELTKRDLQRLAWGLDQVRNIMSSEPISNNIGYETYPGTGYQDANLELFIDHHIMRNSHWSGSSKMGRKDDKDAVVDSELRVHGVKNLRIVDAGVMPFIPNGNTHSTTCAISLRSVDLLFQ